ncbi:unnamed protein product [Vitrella brassicaformis CCMP3155]|uniref:GOLD domain-containing protein n=2 Tax=Vitrella brassicaformis TaxID=1169539 RepID=A0A0G4EE43_VITBC|nr:unnamed protein product [Vitrella brassicaformis CCMP3155]|eukprot:CEL93828.1 unnamed protein product [Vitrella brassicaformis CCMP3155]
MERRRLCRGSPRPSCVVYLWSCVLFYCLCLSRAAYFYVSEGAEKCFLENVPANQVITTTYSNPDNPGVSCSIVFKDPRGRQVFSKEVLAAEPKGKVAHLTTQNGEYKVCIKCQSSKWFSTSLLKWTFSIELGDSDINPEEVAKKDHLNTIQMSVKKLVDRAEAVSAENDYEKLQEEEFAYASEVIGSRVMWFSAAQVILTVTCTVLQIYHLTRFFQTQKII